MHAGRSLVDDRHTCFVVALAGGRAEVVESLDLPGCQLDAVSADVLLDAGDPLRAWDRSDVVALCEQPGKCYLRRCRTRLGRNGLDLIHDSEVALEVLADEARVSLAPIVVGDLRGGPDLTGQETVAERGVRNEADAELAQQWQQLLLRVPAPQRVLRLQSRNPVDGVGAADRGGTGFG